MLKPLVKANILREIFFKYFPPSGIIWACRTEFKLFDLEFLCTI